MYPDIHLDLTLIRNHPSIALFQVNKQDCNPYSPWNSWVMEGRTFDRKKDPLQVFSLLDPEEVTHLKAVLDKVGP